MTLQRMDHVGLVVRDIEAATAFFVELGMEPVGDGSVGGELVGRIVGLEDVDCGFAMLEAPGGSRIELVKFNTPALGDGDSHAPANTAGLRHLCFAVDDIDDVMTRLQPHGVEPLGEPTDYGNSFRLVYVRGPEGIIVELAQPLG